MQDLKDFLKKLKPWQAIAVVSAILICWPLILFAGLALMVWRSALSAPRSSRGFGGGSGGGGGGGSYGTEYGAPMQRVAVDPMDVWAHPDLYGGLPGNFGLNNMPGAEDWRRYEREQRVKQGLDPD